VSIFSFGAFNLISFVLFLDNLDFQFLFIIEKTSNFNSDQKISFDHQNQIL